MTPHDDRRILRWVLLALVGFLALSGVVGKADQVGRVPRVGGAVTTLSYAPSPVAVTTTTAPTSSPTTSSSATPSPTNSPTSSPTPRGPTPQLPHGGTQVFAHHQFLVAYYGTANTGALGVLGETRPDVMDRRLRAAAAPFGGPGRPIQRVYELIVTVVDSSPGEDGSYSHDIARADVRRYIDAAHRHHALLLLDLQPGRSGFLQVAKRWQWALEDPWVGLALDPEWRMGPHQIPARVVGHVKATEVNAVSLWLAALTKSRNLPQKLFMLHQFRTAMIEHIGEVRERRELAMVQHVDGFGTPGQKLDTFHAVARPDKFVMGFKLFYDEDTHRLGPRGVLRIRPHVRFISFQ